MRVYECESVRMCGHECACERVCLALCVVRMCECTCIMRVLVRALVRNACVVCVSASEYTCVFLDLFHTWICCAHSYGRFPDLSLLRRVPGLRLRSSLYPGSVSAGRCRRVGLMLIARTWSDACAASRVTPGSFRRCVPEQVKLRAQKYWFPV